MNVTSVPVRVRIYDKGKCIHDHEANEAVRSDGSDGTDLNTLIRNLRETRSEVNDFLTALIQQKDALGLGRAQEMASHSISSDIESSSSVEVVEEEEEEQEEEEGETRANPKKCKLST